jgi:hypothetical protein
MVVRPTPVHAAPGAAHWVVVLLSDWKAQQPPLQLLPGQQGVPGSPHFVQSDVVLPKGFVQTVFWSVHRGVPGQQI